MDKTNSQQHPKTVFRIATFSDAGGICEIYKYYIEQTTASWRYESMDEAYFVSWIKAHSDQKRPVYVAQISGQIVGYSSLSDFRQGEGYWPCAENSIYVKPEFAGRGIGRELMRLIIELGRQSGLKAIIAGIDADNDSSIRFHQLFGFYQCGLLKNIGWKNNSPRSLLLMQLDLGNP